MKMIVILSPLLLLFLCEVSYVEGQCAITNATLGLDLTQGAELHIRDDFSLTISGVTTGAQASSVTWRRNGEIVNRGTILPNASFFDGGGQAIVGTGPCESQMYRVALGVFGYLPGSYTYTVTNANTTTPVTSPVFNIEDPNPPTGIMLRQVSNRRVQATWTAPVGYPGATYLVFINDHRVDTGGLSVTGTTHTTETLDFGFSVLYRVRATTGTYLSTTATSSTLIIRDVFAPVVSVLSTTATSATLSFSQTTGSLFIDVYSVILNSTSCEGVPTKTGSSNSDILTINGLQSNIQYSVSVTAKNNSAALTATTMTTLTTGEMAPSGSPGAPTSTAITSTSITFTWTEIACLDTNGVITGYTIKYGPVSTPPTIVDHQSTIKSRTISGLAPFTDYIISVRGVNSAGPGNYSTETIIRTTEDRPTSVIGLSGTPMFFSVVLTWSDPVPLNGILSTYTIRYSVNGSSEVIDTTRRTAFTITDLNPNTVISNVRVRAATAAGDGPDASMDDITTFSRPSAVNNIVVQVISNTAVRVSWNNSALPGVTEFVVYYRLMQEMNVVVEASFNSVVINNLVNQAEYVFEVMARATLGDKSVSGPRTGLDSVVLITPAAVQTTSYGVTEIIITAVVVMAFTVILYSVILVSVILVFRYCNKQMRTQEIKLEACSAYEQVRRNDSSAQEKSSVPVGETGLYDTIEETHNNKYYS